MNPIKNFPDTFLLSDVRSIEREQERIVRISDKLGGLGMLCTVLAVINLGGILLLRSTGHLPIRWFEIDALCFGGLVMGAVILLKQAEMIGAELPWWAWAKDAELARIDAVAAPETFRKMTEVRQRLQREFIHAEMAHLLREQNEEIVRRRAGAVRQAMSTT